MQRGSKKNRSLDTWIGTPVLNLLATFRRRRTFSQLPVGKIGVVCSPALGDTLLFSSALQDLREAFPETEIVHVCMKQNLAAAEMIPGADRRLQIDLTQPFETLRLLRNESFPVLLDFTSWQRLTAFYTLAAGASYTVGFATAGQMRSRGYDVVVEHRDDRHEVANFRALLLASGLKAPWGRPHPPAVVSGHALPAGLVDDEDVVALHLWASGQRSHLREWPEDRWLALAASLAKSGTVFLVTGGPGDRGRSEAFAERMRQAGLRSEAFISPDGFQTLTGVLQRCRLVVSVNTGVMHLAAIAGAPTVSINGPNRNGRWGPVGPRALGVEAPGNDCGFLHLGFNFDGNPADCMERIPVEAVAFACESLLAATGKSSTDALDGAVGEAEKIHATHA